MLKLVPASVLLATISYIDLMIATGLTLIITGALIMFFNMPKGRDVTQRIKMKRWVRIGMGILVLGTVLQLISIYNS